MYLYSSILVWNVTVCLVCMLTSETSSFLCPFQQEVKNAILEDIVRLGKEGGLKSFEQVS